MKTKRLTELSLMTALALAIFVLELRLPNPLPIPGAKLGLANIITVVALYRYSAKETGMILLSRILLGALFGGSGLSLMYSIAGGLCCYAGMLALKRLIPQNQLWLCSVCGAVFHNIGQMSIAVAIAGLGMLGYLPFLMLSGCLAGAFTGLCAQMIRTRLNNRMEEISK